MESNRLILFKAAVDSLYKDASPQDKASDELGCAESVEEIHKKAFGFPICWNEQHQLSTLRLEAALTTHSLFDEVLEPLEGDIIISATSKGNGRLANGHVGIVGQSGKVMSNDSRTGMWLENYTIDSWKKVYKQYGGFPVRFFRRVGEVIIN